MDFGDYLLLKKGFFNKKVSEERLLRKAVKILLTAWAKDEPDEFRFWPLPDDDLRKKEISEYRKAKGMEVSEHGLKMLKAFKELDKNNGT